jgi:hypothetical protein
MFVPRVLRDVGRGAAHASDDARRIRHESPLPTPRSGAFRQTVGLCVSYDAPASSWEHSMPNDNDPYLILSGMHAGDADSVFDTLSWWLMSGATLVVWTGLALLLTNA